MEVRRLKNELKRLQSLSPTRSEGTSEQWHSPKETMASLQQQELFKTATDETATATKQSCVRYTQTSARVSVPASEAAQYERNILESEGSRTTAREERGELEQAKFEQGQDVDQSLENEKFNTLVDSTRTSR